LRSKVIGDALQHWRGRAGQPRTPPGFAHAGQLDPVGVNAHDLGPTPGGQDTGLQNVLSYDNALAETINGLYKTELIKPRKPWRTIEDVEVATAGWVYWFQPPPPLRVLRRHPARRTRDGLLRSTTETSSRLSPQIGKSPDSPGRFIMLRRSLSACGGVMSRRSQCIDGKRGEIR
jgi:hypothetical protein